MTVLYEFDDLFVYAPSFLIAEREEAEGHLFEGKALATARREDLIAAQTLGKFTNLDPALGSERKTGQTVGKRKLKAVQNRVTTRMTDLIGRYQVGDVSEAEFRKLAKQLMRTAWKDVFQAGMRASGAAGLGAGKGKTAMVKMSPGDDKWLKGAMKHEMQFLNKFLTAIVSDDYRMPLERRLKMYVGALESFYDSARVIAMPGNVLINWIGPQDGKMCPGCEYIIANNPYTKFTLPTTPRSGLTPCLTNCRHRLLIRRVPDSAVKAREKSQPYTIGTMLKHLRQIKRTGRPIAGK